MNMLPSISAGLYYLIHDPDFILHYIFRDAYCVSAFKFEAASLRC